MTIFFSNKLLVIETNVGWALPYWQKRKQHDQRIRWTFN